MGYPSRYFASGSRHPDYRVSDTDSEMMAMISATTDIPVVMLYRTLSLKSAASFARPASEIK